MMGTGSPIALHVILTSSPSVATIVTTGGSTIVGDARIGRLYFLIVLA